MGSSWNVKTKLHARFRAFHSMTNQITSRKDKNYSQRGNADSTIAKIIASFIQENLTS